MLLIGFFVVWTSIVAAAKPGLRYPSKRYTGIATFNEFSSQSNTVCGLKSGKLSVHLPLLCY